VKSRFWMRRRDRKPGFNDTPGEIDMYIRRIKGPGSVTLPDGTIMTRADLPDPQTRRWVASRKAAVVRAVDHGLISEAEARETWHLSERGTCRMARGGRASRGGGAQGDGAATLPGIAGRWRRSVSFSYFADRWIHDPFAIVSSE
jgi:hypothetical protein